MSKEEQSAPHSQEKTTKSPTKNNLECSYSQTNILQENLDLAYLYTFEQPLLRVEYPGYVKNIDKALETLGGVESIERAMDGKKLQLSFHPKNKFIKGCTGDVDHSIGFLLKVKRNKSTKQVSYEVVGACDTVIKFNKMCDFQYLPLLPKDKPEHKDSEVDFIHNKIMPEKLPNLEWFNRKDNPLFLLSAVFARFDMPQVQFKSNACNMFNSLFRSDAPLQTDFSRKKMKEDRVTSTIKVPLNVGSPVIPTEPNPEVTQNPRLQFLDKEVKKVQAAFEERPIWTKPALMHKTGLRDDFAKIIFPTVSYLCVSGAWRNCWIKFGYNPTTCPTSRIYQIFDYRVRHTDGVQLKIKIKHHMPTSKSGRVNNPSHYSLRPNEIPPARQMFYQYCDILLPEVQEMLAKLPKVPTSLNWDPKNGWLPVNFQDQCREIVNKYVYEAVRNDILNETKQKENLKKSSDIVGYCSQMLSNIRDKGISRVVEHINLSDDEEEEIGEDELMDSLPERLPESIEDEAEEEFDMEIDLEALEEVNELVAGMKDQKL